MDAFLEAALAEVAQGKRRRVQRSKFERSKFEVLVSEEVLIAFDRSPRRDDRTRINERIRVREIRVIDDDGQQLGIMPPPQALALARSKSLDLVEISPTAVPPVCRIMDFGKFQYEQQKRARQAKKHQKVILVKEIKFRPKVDEHDYQFKKKHIERFLARRRQGQGDDLLPRPRERASGNRAPDSGAADRRAERRSASSSRSRRRKATSCTRFWRRSRARRN